MLQFAVPRRTFSFLAIVAVIGISLAIVVVEGARADLLHSNRWVIHTLEVERAFQALLATMLDTETTCRRSIPTDGVESQAGCEQTQRLASSHMATLQHLTADNPEQQRRLTSIASLATAGEADLSEVRTLIQAGVEHEQRLLVERQNRLKAAIEHRPR